MLLFRYNAKIKKIDKKINKKIKKIKKVIDKRKKRWYINIRLPDGREHFENWTANKPKTIQFREKTAKKNTKTKKHAKSVNRARKNLYEEFDPGSGWTPAACLTHASRTKICFERPSGKERYILSGGRVSNAWVICLCQGDNIPKGMLIPYEIYSRHLGYIKDESDKDEPAFD